MKKIKGLDKISQFKDKYGLKKEKPKEPFGKRFANFIKRWSIRLFHTVFFLVFVYVFLLSIVNVLPMSLGIILSATGFTLTTTSEVILVVLTGLFIVAWVFVISRFAVVKAGQLYLRNMKKTLSQDFINKFKGEDNKPEDKDDSKK